MKAANPTNHLPEASTAPPTKQRGQSRVQSIDSLRGVAAFAVMAYHFTAYSDLFNADTAMSRGVKAAFAHGHLGVPVFFVISGFVLPYSLTAAGYRWSYFSAFVAKRLLRLEPTYLCSLAIHLCLWGLASRLQSFHGEPLVIEPGRLLAHFGYLCDLLGYEWYSQNYWTLGQEFQFYLAVALAMPVLFGAYPLWRWVLIGCLIAADFLGVPSSLFISRGALFAMGIEAFALRSRDTRTAADIALAVAATVTIAVTQGVLTALVALGAAGIVFCDALPRWRPVLWLGSVSYSLYLFHTIIGQRFLHLASRFVHDDLSRLIVLMASIGVSLLAAWIVCRCVEWPSQRMAARIRYKPRPSQP